MSQIPLQKQIDCVRRELQMRSIVYPSRVRQGWMKQATADYETAAMTAVLATLVGLEAAQKVQPKLAAVSLPHCWNETCHATPVCVLACRYPKPSEERKDSNEIQQR